VRATVAASWYRQMGFPHVYVVDGGTQAWVAGGLSLAQTQSQQEAGGYDEGLLDDLPSGYEQARNRVATITPQSLQAQLQSPTPPVMLFVDISRDFSTGHVPGAHWLSRSWLELRIGEIVPTTATPVVVTCTNGVSALLAGATLQDMGYQRVSALAGGMHAWVRAGLPVEPGLSGVMSPPNDVLLMGTDRTWADAIHYLQWEEELGKKYETAHP
jgi:rhodanese-related sulfurtransferase